MISFRDQVILIIYFLIYGMFLSAMYDILHFYLTKLKVRLIISYLIQLVVWIGLVIISCLFILKVSEGYLTIYTFGFFFIGIVIHVTFLSKDFNDNLRLSTKYSEKIYKKTKKTIILVIYPKEVLDVIYKITCKLTAKIKTLFIKLYKLVFVKKKQKGIKDEIDQDLISIYNDAISSDN